MFAAAKVACRAVLWSSEASFMCKHKSTVQQNGDMSWILELNSTVQPAQHETLQQLQQQQQQRQGQLAAVHRQQGQCRSLQPPALTQLHGISMAGELISPRRELSRLHAVAPNLQELFCDILDVSSTEEGSLPHLTVLGAACVPRLEASTVSKLFPRLAATFQLQCTAVRAASDPLWPCMEAAQLTAMRRQGGDSLWLPRHGDLGISARLMQLRHLTWHNANLSDDSPFPLSRLSCLQSLSITYMQANKRRVKQLLADALSLPQLQRLALPAKLVCSSCCASGQGCLLGLLLTTYCLLLLTTCTTLSPPAHD